MTVAKKDEVVTIIAQEKEITKKAAEAWLDDAAKTIETIITEYGQGFKLGSLITFDVVDVEEAEKEHRNPQTGEKFKKVHPAHYALKTKVASTAKEALKALKANEA